MKVTKTISIDLARRDTIRGVLAVEGDSGTRSVEILLKNQFEPWAVPEGVTASLAYKKSDGTAGWYDTLPDGSEACTIDGSTILVELAPQVLSAVGKVLAAVVLRDEAGRQLTTFEFLIDVRSSPAGCGASEDYYNLKVVASIEDLQAQIDELKENGVGNSTLVQSVNGIAPDENGNVEIDFDDPVENDPTVFDWAKRELFNKADLPTSIQSFVTVDGIEYYRYHAGATYGFTWYNPSPLPGAVTITARGVAQYGGTNGTRLKTIYSDGTYGPDLYIVASGESRTVTVTTDTSKTLAKITGNYDMENWVLLDMSVMSVQAEYNRGLPLADSNAAGGVLADPATDADTIPARIKDGRLFVAGATDEQIAQAVSDYMADHPIEVPGSSQNVELDTTLTQSGKAADAKAVGDKIAEITGISLVEPAEDDIPKVFFSGDNSGMSKDIEKVLQFAYKSRTANFGGYVKMKWQGSSTLVFPKKNFTIKMFEEEACETKIKKAFKHWGVEKNKYVLKANYIDHTHARNIVTANLWAEMVKCRPDFDSLPDGMKNAPGHGAIDGFPIKLYLNGVYQGIYTWTIGKEDWMFGMDETDANNAALCAEKNNNGNASTTDSNILACEFRGNANIDGNDWDLEFPDSLNANIKTSFNNLINCVKDTDDATFKATIGNYLDLTSAFDYYILAYLSANVDGLAKNLIMMTYDGVKWFCSAYDMDNIWGSRGTSDFVDATLPCPEDYYDDNSLLWQRIESCFGAELYARYLEVRKTVLNFENVIDKFERFCDLIGSELYAEDVEIYSGIPYPSQNNLKQIRSFFAPRAEYVDACMAEIGTPVVTVPCTGISLSASELTFTTKGSQTMTATIEPDGCTDAVTWESTDSTIASVTGGVVTAKANGSATITAKCGEYSASCAVSVSGIESGTEGEYVTDGLVVHLDARDVLSGDTLWTSRVNDVDFTLYGFDESLIGDDAVTFNGAQTVQAYHAVDTSDGVTVEFRLSGVDTRKKCNRIFVQCINVNGGKGQLGVTHANGWAGCFGYVADTYGSQKIHGTLQLPEVSLCVTVATDGTRTVYLNGGKVISGVTMPPVDFESLNLGCQNIYSTEGFVGKLHSFRVYERVLTEDEIATNFTVDNAIFGDIEEIVMNDYVLPSAVTLAGVSDAIDTKSYLNGANIDYTIALDMTPEYQDAERTVFACMDSTAIGIKFAAHPSFTGYRLIYNGATLETNIPYATEERIRATIRRTASDEVFTMDYSIGGEKYSGTLSGSFKPCAVALFIGCDDGSLSPVRPWYGTMHNFAIYNRLMTDDEVSEFLNG